jgi:uncharacterized oligopeptide transporter (OPT) family protein
MAVMMLLAAALFSAVAGYMAGLVGSSNDPISPRSYPPRCCSSC